MKALNFLMIAILVMACHKKHDDPAPVAKKNITVYITKGDYYPNSTDYYALSNLDLRTPTTVVLSNTYLYPGLKGAGEFLNVGDANNYSISFLLINSNGYSYGNANWNAAVPQGVTNTHVDSLFIHTVYQ